MTPPKKTQDRQTPSRPGDAERANAVKTAVELAADALETMSMPEGGHPAPMGGMELLVEIAKLADLVLAAHQHAAAQPHSVEPVDPRRCVDPRKRILPR